MKAVVVLSLVVVMVSSYEQYRDLIPNGHNVLNPCDAIIWAGVGHVNPMGRGELNPFGEAFTAANHNWTAVCNLDSDGDGKTNGKELGDPLCLWTIGATPSAHVEGHPGVCEPYHAPRCANSIFSCTPGGVTVPVG